MNDTSNNHRITLGRSGLEVSPICFGTWQLSPAFWGPPDEEEITLAVRRAYELGINFYDTANAYGDGLAETVLGRALAELPRDQVVVATKGYWRWREDGSRFADLSRDGLVQQCEESLVRLGLDTIDLYQCHAWDPLAEMHGTVEAMEKLKAQGKIRAYGHSNWSPEQMRLGEAAGGQFDTCQPMYSLLRRDIEKDVLPYCRANGIGVLVYSPLHHGLLSGKYRGTETFDDLRDGRADFSGTRFKAICDAVGAVGTIAGRYDLSTVQLVLTATLMYPAIHCAITGIKRVAHIEDAAGALGRMISREDWYGLRKILTV